MSQPKKKLLVVRLATGREIEVPDCGGAVPQHNALGFIELVLQRDAGSYRSEELGRFRYGGPDGAIGWYVTDIPEDLRIDAEEGRAALENAHDSVNP